MFAPTIFSLHDFFCKSPSLSFDLHSVLYNQEAIKALSRPLHSNLKKIQGLEFKKIYELLVRARLPSLLNQGEQEIAIIMYKVNALVKNLIFSI